MKWRNNIEMTEQEEQKVKALQNAGCKCPDFPLLGGTPGKNFRCRICNIEISESPVLMDDESTERTLQTMEYNIQYKQSERGKV